MTRQAVLPDCDPLDASLVLAGGGEMGALMRAIDWSRTTIGPVESWPQSLRTALSILLETGFPMYIAWGASFTQFYNDGYRPILGSTKHPAAMGISTRETFSEIWDIIGPMFEGVMQGTPVTLNDFHLPLDRHGFIEECYFVLSYSPIREEAGKVGGVLVTVTETTERVLGARRLATLQALAGRTQSAASVANACGVVCQVLHDNPADLPFSVLYLQDPKSGKVVLAGSTDLSAGIVDAAPALDVPGSHVPWPFAEVFGSREPVLVQGPITGWPSVAAATGVTNALALPIFTGGADAPTGVLIAGLSPRLPLDANYRGFLELVAGHVGSAIASAKALQDAKAQAEALALLDRQKTDFFSNVSHEFRTPITLILGPAEDALAQGGGSTEERERWSIVQRNAFRLSKLVNTLLDFSRLEAGRIQASYEKVNLAASTVELASMFRSAVDRCGLALRLQLPELEEPAYVDREMWEKIVLNLLSNALKFTFEGEIAVQLDLHETEFVLTVRDTGIGIAEEELPFVFERFHRVRGARGRTHEGTGIGLALVAELAQLHGGSASVVSAPGRGTTFRVSILRGAGHLPPERIGAVRTLPSTATGATPYVEEALRWPVENSVAPVSIVPPETPVPTNDARPRIVLADDNADMREYLTRLLTERWRVDAFADGEAAWAAICAEPPDLILTDVMMPGLDGFGLLRAVRADPVVRTVPVILLSARAGEEATAEGLTAGANDYVVKPFSARELLVRVASQLASSRVFREAHAIEQAARERLYEHFMQAPFPVSVLRGPNHVLELANSLSLSAWGKTQAIVGKPIIDGLPELRGQPFIGYLDEVFRTGVAYQARAALARLVRSASGEVEDVYFDFVYAPLRAASGEVDGILVCGFEVTAQVKSAQQLASLLATAESNERQLRELVENMPELAWTARGDGHIDYYNQRWYEYTGTTYDEMKGWGWRAVHSPQLVDGVLARWQQSLETGEVFEMEFPLKGKDGNFRWFLTRVRPIRDAEGKVTRWFGVNTDIDERRRNDDFRETFLGILGHDLRNPLSTILTTARVLGMRGELPPETRTRLGRIVSSGVRMQRMIDQLLDLTRARLADGIPVYLSEEKVDLLPITTKIVEEMRAAHPAAVIQLADETFSFAKVDVDRLEQVLSNLLGNAIAHGDPSRPIRVGLGTHSGAVTISVHNYGPAIDPDLIPRLFNPFARGKLPAGRSEGLGLGLYISERIVAAHRGKLTVESSVDAGTRFEVHLPA